MHTPQLLVIIIVLAMPLCTGAQGPAGLQQQYVSNAETKQLFDKYLRTPDSADEKIDELVTLAKKDGLNTAGNAMLKLQAALMLEQYVARPGKATFGLNVSLGQIFSGLNPSTAIFFYRKALAISNASPKIIPDERYFLLGALGGQFANLKNSDSTLAYYHLAEEEGAKTPKINVARASIANNIGFYFGRIGRHDSAMAYFNNALALLGNIQNDPILYCSVRDNVAEEKELAGNEAEAVGTYRFNDSVYLAMQRPNRYVINKVRLLAALKKIHATAVELENHISLANNYINTHAGNIRLPEILKFYGFASAYFFEANDKQAEGRYTSLYNALRDTIEQQTAEKLNIISALLLNVQAASFASEYQAQQLLVKRQQTALIITAPLAVAGAGVIALLILYMRKRRQQHASAQLFAAEQLKNKELEARAAVHGLELKKKDLTSVVLYNTQVYENNKKLIEHLNDITHKGDGMERSLKSLLIDLQSQSQLGDTSITMQHNITHVNAEFREKLHQTFPGLTLSEAELCGYIRINLSNKDISVLKNVEPDSIKKSKNRLKKKLGLAAEDDLYVFISGL